MQVQDVSDIWASPPKPPAGWPPCEWCGKKLDNPRYFVVRDDGAWFTLCLTCITAGDTSAGSITCRRCGRAIRRNEARLFVTRKRPARGFRKVRVESYECAYGCPLPP